VYDSAGTSVKDVSSTAAATDTGTKGTLEYKGFPAISDVADYGGFSFGMTYYPFDIMEDADWADATGDTKATPWNIGTDISIVYRLYAAPLTKVDGGISGTATGNGFSWKTASSDIQKLIDLAGKLYALDSSAPKEIWVAGGTYTPNTGEKSFQLKDGVALYGGFKGTETKRPSGLGLTSFLKGDNTAHVISATGDITSTLDGFTITGGKDTQGGGVYNNGSTLTLTNVIIADNTASDSGGGIYNGASSTLTLINVLLAGNGNDTTLPSKGGGIYNEGTAKLINVTISNNTSKDGGGIYNASSTMTVDNSIVWGNKAISGVRKAGGSIRWQYSLAEGSGGSGATWE
jgi:predicted outer membrane repeat protein